ncbi:MAG: hypothetical protein NTX05_05830 [Fusobacteria bacterium]|nr:hypothetical protein [Fusobacteriota bacterium]
MTQLEKLIEKEAMVREMSISQEEVEKFYTLLKEEMKIACKSKRLFWFEMDFDNPDIELQDRAYLKRRIKTNLKGILTNSLDLWLEVFAISYKSYKNPIFSGKKF